MTLAVRSAVMEHYKSTLATTAFAVFGLVVAAHTLHPGNYEVQPRAARMAAAPTGLSSPSATWADPPARLAIADGVRSDSGLARPAAPDLLAPQITASLPPGALTAPALSSAMTGPGEKSRTALAPHRTKVADRNLRRVARSRHANLARTAAIDPAVAAPAASPAPAPQKIDPIGDLIRGLGLGGADHEG